MADLLDRIEAALADRYRIERELDSDGMALVYLAHDQKLDHSVLLKVLRPDLAASVGVERFVGEIEVAAQLTHPNILAPYDCGEADGLLYYVTECVEGESLRRLLRRKKRLPTEDAVEIASHVAAALDHAHGQGVVHRDIRPENILLPVGQAVVADFGVARAVRMAGGEQITEMVFSKAKPHYISPEQVLGDEVDARSDLYSLGATLFEVVTGEKPFEGETAQQIVGQHIAKPVREPREVEPDVPAWMSDLIVRCLQKEPNDRFQSAAEVLDALETGGASLESTVPRSGTEEDIGVPKIVQGAGWEFDEVLTPEVKPPPQPVYDVGPVEQTAPAPTPPEPATPGGDLILGAWVEMAQPEPAAAAPPPPSEPPATPEEPPAESAELSEVADSTRDVVEAETPIDAEPAEPAPEEEVTQPRRVPPWLMQLYGMGPELLVRLSRQRETWYYVGGGSGLVLGVVLVWLAVKSLFFGPPSLHYQFVRNALVEPVQILVDGQTVHFLQPGEQDSLLLPQNRPIEVAWRLIRPRQGRQEMGEEFEVVLSTGRRRGEDARSVITGVTADRAMFAPRITNRTNRDLVALVNAGLPMELRCNCVIPSGSRDLHIGYYPLFESSAIRFFDARRPYSGEYQEIGDISGRVDTLSGSVNLTVERR
ncbi:MAG: protein kinase [Gemmatimonadales bacterium]|nr:protein kinase [Gemmatimonadales bacterium]NIN12242.1 protein kinase [Gemmatimonadales bacterium]NIQ99365.1 protein kinase [Gemmatimonadales bacterium]NIS64046.1 protein kinase [Gemmatimonadales bacterium]